MQLLEKQFFSVCTRANTKKIARARRKINSALNSCHDLKLVFSSYALKERLAVTNIRVIRTKRVNGCIRYFPTKKAYLFCLRFFFAIKQVNFKTTFSKQFQNKKVGQNSAFKCFVRKAE